jgi:hypothetical protein
LVVCDSRLAHFCLLLTAAAFHAASTTLRCGVFAVDWAEEEGEPYQGVGRQGGSRCRKFAPIDGRDETVFLGREVVLKQSANSLCQVRQGEAQTRGTVMLVAILNSIYRHFITAAIVGMAVTQGSRR